MITACLEMVAAFYHLLFEYSADNSLRDPCAFRGDIDHSHKMQTKTEIGILNNNSEPKFSFTELKGYWVRREG